MPLLTVENLRVHFHTRAGIVRAVEGISYAIAPGETLGIVGESGCGKSVSQYALLGLIPKPPGRIEGGTARFDGQDLLTASPRALRSLRGKRISMIFQDPMTALNPFMRVGMQIMEPLLVHEALAKKAAWKKAVDALESVGIQDAERRMDMFPHEFSGGMRQRVLIAMALITRPDLLIADEPTTALDVTVQAQIMALIKARQEDLGMAVVLITHDLGVVAGACDRMLVMYAGRIVEAAAARSVFKSPRHPYTRALLDSLPAVHGAGEALYTIPGLPPDLSDTIAGCAFAPRCPSVQPACKSAACELREVWSGHESACVRVQSGELEEAQRGR